MPAGRPSKFTPEISKVILDEVRQGYYPADVAESVGITKPTLRTWLRLGKRTEARYQQFREFLSAYRQAEAQGRKRLQGIALGLVENGRLTAGQALEILSRIQRHVWGADRQEVRKLARDQQEMRKQLDEIRSKPDARRPWQE